MNTLDAFQDRARVTVLAARVEAIARSLPEPVTFMEVCGTHTHAIAAAGLRRLLPHNVRLVSGPGCPVCVTPIDWLDHAIALAERPDVTLCTFGDLMRVPASRRDSLEKASARGADIRIVYSPRDALAIARDSAGRKVVFLGVGFETTMPTIAAALAEAEEDGIRNFLVFAGGKLIGPPLRALLGDPDLRLQGFLLPGHVSVILGSDFYAFLPRDHGVGGAIVGFGPVDILAGIAELLEQVRTRTPRIANLYARVVSREGNRTAQELMARFFEPADSRWRGLGAIPASGLALRKEFAHRDAAQLPVELAPSQEPKSCRCGEILKGAITPPQCPLFGHGCDPDHPIGACMVSSEGTCAAWFRHERQSVGAGR